MDTRVPDLLIPVFDTYLQMIDQQLPGLLDAFYLEGSLALGAFDERWSDIDFVAVLTRRCTAEEVVRLQAFHRTLEHLYPRWPWQGEYLLSWEEWTHPQPDSRRSLTYHAGRFHLRTQLDLHAHVMLWTLKQHGFALRGPDPQHLALPLKESVLRSQMQRNLTTYWAGFVQRPPRMAWLLTDYGIQWVVLGVLRPWYTLENHDIVSKTQAGAAALTRLPLRWHRVIHEALRIRQRDRGVLYRSRLERAIDAARLVRYLIERCVS
jgi:hypothetical protein